MNRQIPWFWILLAALLLSAPTPLGRVLLDLLGGFTLLILVLPLLLAGAGVVAFQILRRRIRTCSVCGLSSVGQTTCPACGAPLQPTPDPGGEQESPFTTAEAPSGSLYQGLMGRRSQTGVAPPPVRDPTGNIDVRDVTIDVESRSVSEE